MILREWGILLSEWVEVCDSRNGKGLLLVIDSKRSEEFLNASAGGYFSASEYWAGTGHYLNIYLHKSNQSRTTAASFAPNKYAGVRVIY